MIRFIRKRELDVLELVTEITDIKNLTVENNTESSVNALVNGVGNGNCQKGRCGPEAACKPLHNNRYMCVCPHDSSPPTVDLRCPNRLTVPITPKPIHNIIPPGGSNDTVNVTTVMHTSSQRTLISEESIYHNDMKIFIIGSALTVVLVIFFIVFWCKRRALAKLVGIETSNKVPLSPSPLKKSILLSERYTINTQYSPCLTYTVPLIQSDTLTFLDEIGEGCFGKVFKGELRREGSDHVEIVAIKVLKDSVSRKAEEDFMREVDVMSAFRHENILSLIGIVIKDPGLNPIMVFEYMDYGDLAEVLRQNSRSYNTIDSKHKTSILDKRELLSIALQIAAGMRYLAAQRFVHRDLACRNCLVAQGLVVKIADFGMSRDVYTCDYYKIGGSRLLPVRWMSPESVMYGKFTLESDIWSYGVVMWEIYSYGKQPYFGHTNEEVVQLILHGTMLNLPDDCPPLISKLIHSCWRVEPRDRIPFTEIYDELHSAYECYEDKNISVQLNVSCDRDESKEKSNKVILLPRPPLEPIAQLADLLDSDGYLLPQEATRVNYLQTVSD